MSLFLLLAIHHAKCMLHIILSFVACLAVQYFPTLSNKLYDFHEQNILNVKCCF